MVQTGKTANAVITVNQQVAGVQIVERVQPLEHAGRHAGRLFGLGVEDVLPQHKRVVPGKIRSLTER